jgi:hypothetical protein
MKEEEAATAVAPRERCPVLTRVPVGFIAVISVLLIVAAVFTASAMTASGSHRMDSASGVVWANW